MWFWQGGRLLVAFLARLKSLPADVGDAGCQALLDLWKRFIKVSRPLGIEVPKTHLMLHCVLRARTQGNPLLFQTFIDEGLNSTLKKVLRLCHQSRFEAVALWKLNEALSRAFVRRRLN